MSPEVLKKLIEENPGIQGALRIRIAAELGAPDASFPVILTSPGLDIRGLPYAQPLPASVRAVGAAFDAVQSVNPVEAILSDSLIGPGTMTLGLPGAPGIATGADRFALLNLFLLDVSVDANTPKQPFSVDAAGVFYWGGAYTMPTVQFAWNDKSNDTEQILVCVAEETAQGPRHRPMRLTTSDFPGALLNNGAPNAAAGDLLTVNVTAAAATANFTLTGVTAGHEMYDLVNELMALAPALGMFQTRPTAKIDFSAAREMLSRLRTKR